MGRWPGPTLASHHPLVKPNSLGLKLSAEATHDATRFDRRPPLICRTLDAARKLTSPTIRRLSTRMDFQFRDIEVASSLVLHMLPATPNHSVRQ